MEEVKTLCKQLCDKTKESSSKFDLKNKLMTVEKPYAEISKKLEERKKNLEGAVAEGEKFNTQLSDMVKWVVGKQEEVESLPPLSGQAEILANQAREHEVRYFIKSYKKLVQTLAVKIHNHCEWPV